MFETLDSNQSSLTEFAANWRAIERSLEVATKAEGLRARSRALREVSRLLREESLRLSRDSISTRSNNFPSHR